MKGNVTLLKASDISLPKTNLEAMHQLRKLSFEFHVEAHELADTLRRFREDSTVLSGVFNILNDAIIRVSGDGSILYMNPTAEKLFGADRVMCKGRSISFLAGLSLKDLLEELNTNGKNQLKMFNLSGRYFDASLSVTEVEHGKDKIEYVFVIRDMSDILKMKSALIDSDTKFEVLSKALDEATDVIIISDSNNKIIFCNKAFTEHTGYSYKEAIGKNPGFYKSGKTHDEVYEDMWQTVRSGKVWHGMFINTAFDGRLLTDDTTITPVLQTASSMPTFYIAVKKVIQKGDLNERFN